MNKTYCDSFFHKEDKEFVEASFWVNLEVRKWEHDGELKNRGLNGVHMCLGCVKKLDGIYNIFGINREAKFVKHKNEGGYEIDGNYCSSPEGIYTSGYVDIDGEKLYKKALVRDVIDGKDIVLIRKDVEQKDA